MIDSSSHASSDFFWTFHIWYKVMSNTCYKFSPWFLFLCSSQSATILTFTSETSLILLPLKCLPSNPTKKLLVKIAEHKLEETFSDSIRRDVQLGHFILLSVLNSQQLPKLTSPYFFGLLKWLLKLNRTTVRWFWTINHFWKLEIILLQVTSYKAPFLHPPP